jgi:coproporphyrinogen III oxidase
MTKQQEDIGKWVKKLQDNICSAYEKIEREFDGDGEPGKFEEKNWKRNGGGGGDMRIMRGRVFEKVGVNISKVYGKFDPEFAKEIPGTEKSLEFFACGISLVTHMKSPHIPTIHMNTRYIETAEHWFGGGIDLTPTIVYEEDSEYFHGSLKAMCDKYNRSYYDQFKKACDEYFYIKHWNEMRGIGGIFYDRFNTGNFEQDFNFMQDVGKLFLKISPELVQRHLSQSWTDEEKNMQFKKRAKYTEFNLLYDRGTKFGFMTGGNPEAILVSLPPVAHW